MRRFISLPNKILLLLVVMSISLGVSLSWLWLTKTNQDFLRKQQEIRQQNQQQYLLLNQLFRTRLESWVEMFVQLQEDQSRPIASLADTLEDKIEFLRLNWQVEELWLANSQGQLVFGTVRPMPEQIRRLQQSVFEEQRSLEEIRCQESCAQLLSIPILTLEGDMAVISMNISLLETLAFLNQSTQATLAQVYLPGNPSLANARDLVIRGPLSHSTLTTIQSLIQQFPDAFPVQKLLSEGIQLRVDNKDFLLNLITMTQVENDGNYVLLAHDISPITQAHQQYQRSVLATMVGVLFIVGLLFYLLINNLRKRLLRLSEQLPLLAKRDYEGFDIAGVNEQKWVDDELDMLQESASLLATELEALDLQVQEKTSELEKIAMYDPLTGLPNRNMLTFQLEKALAALHRKNGFVVVLFLDLDDFKKVNDSHGHGVGDGLLCEASNRLQKVLRKSDLASRFGGDEFVILLENVTALEGALRVADKLLEALKEPVKIGQQRFYVSTSIGISAGNEASQNAEELIRHADIAMYQAKTAGGNCRRIYDSEMSKNALQKVALEEQARDALKGAQFTYALQPQVELKTGRLEGFEALIRWEHPERGMISPGLFIPVLENTEFMLSLGYWGIEHAFEILEKFRAAGHSEYKIAINLSGGQFLDPDLIPFLKNKIDQTGIRPDLIELELTERTLVADVEKTTKIMQQLIDLGCIISIDDFGTGYSSLSYLKKMPAQIIKIDRSFIDGMLVGTADKQIVASTISMVQKLGMKVVAEGIEEKEQLDLLNEMGCDLAQGYFIARPIPEAQLFETLEKHVASDIWHIDPLSKALTNGFVES